ERDQLLAEWNETKASYPWDRRIQELFEQQVGKTSEAIALVYENRQLSYAELNQRANLLAHHLKGLGVRPEERVGICMERGLEMVTGLLGILKAGGAYLPLDPGYPAERLRFMLEDGAPLALLTEERWLGRLPKFKGETVCLDRDWSLIAEQSEENPKHEAREENPAYIIYTSGSTGRPKGVVGLQGGTVNRFAWMWQTYPFAAEDVACQKTSLSFVDSVWEVFGPLLQGIQLVIIAEEIARDGRRLAQILEEEEVSRIVLAPSLPRSLLDNIGGAQCGIRGLRYCSSSGEALPPELVKAFSSKLPESRLLNLYGSSEVSADATWHEVASGEPKTNVPI